MTSLDTVETKCQRCGLKDMRLVQNDSEKEKKNINYS